MQSEEPKLSLPQLKAIAAGQIAESMFLTPIESISLHEMWKQMILRERDWKSYAVSLMFHMLPGGVHKL